MHSSRPSSIPHHFPILLSSVVARPRLHIEPYVQFSLDSYTHHSLFLASSFYHIGFPMELDMIRPVRSLAQTVDSIHTRMEQTGLRLKWKGYLIENWVPYVCFLLYDSIPMVFHPPSLILFRPKPTCLLAHLLTSSRHVLPSFSLLVAIVASRIRFVDCCPYQLL